MQSDVIDERFAEENKREYKQRNGKRMTSDLFHKHGANAKRQPFQCQIDTIKLTFRDILSI